MLGELKWTCHEALAECRQTYCVFVYSCVQGQEVRTYQVHEAVVTVPENVAGELHGLTNFSTDRYMVPLVAFLKFQ